MSGIDKLLKKMRNNPLDWRIEDVEKLASHFGFFVRKTSGSHVTFSHKKLQQILTIPARKPIKPIYIKNLLKIIEQLENEK